MLSKIRLVDLQKCRALCKLTNSSYSIQASQIKNENAPKPFDSIPKPKSYPVIGTALDYSSFKNFKIENYLDHLIDRHKMLGPIFREAVVPNIMPTTVFVSSQKDNEVMTRADGPMPIRTGLEALAKLRDELGLGAGVSTTNGKEWHRVRRVVNQHFLSNDSVWSYSNGHYQVAKDFADYIQKNLDSNNEIQDTENALKRWSMESTGVFSLDTRLGLFEKEIPEESKHFMEQMKIFFESLNVLLRGFPTWKLYKSKTYKKLQETQVAVRDSVKKHRANIQKKRGFSGKTKLSEFIDSELNDSEKETVMIDFLGGGIETTAYSAVFPLYLLAKHPEKQEKLRKEIEDNIDDDIVAGKKIQQLRYLNACMHETQRLFPFTPGYARIYDRDIVLSGYTIPAGTNVFNTSNLVNNRDPEYFEDPNSFIPERWLDQGQRRKAAFAMSGSFGTGARMCPGRKFAIQEINLLLVALLKRFRIEYHYQPIDIKFCLLIIPSENPRFTFVPLK